MPVVDVENGRASASREVGMERFLIPLTNAYIWFIVRHRLSARSSPSVA
jgi:hypothetical protein